MILLQDAHWSNSTMTAEADQQSSKKLNLEKAINFMRQYRDPESRELKKLSANQFMEVWSHYDKDGKQNPKIVDFCLRILQQAANIGER